MQAMKTIWDDASQTYKQVPAALESILSQARAESRQQKEDMFNPSRTYDRILSERVMRGQGITPSGMPAPLMPLPNRKSPLWGGAFINVEGSDAPHRTFGGPGDLPSWMPKRTEGQKQPTNQSQNQSDTQSYGDPFAQQLQSVKSDQTPQPMSPQVMAPAQTGYTATAEAPMSNLPLKSMNRARKVNPYWAYQMR